MANQKVTIKDIAAKAGVSISLVSFVMSNEMSGKDIYKVNPDTAKRILKVAEDLNYKPNDAARALRSGKFNTIGVLLSDISNNFFSDIARCIEDKAYKHNITVIFGSTDENPNKLQKLIEAFCNKGVDGLIIVPCEGSDDAIKRVIKKNIPLVLLDREVKDIDVSSVVLNNRNASYQITESLIKQGSKKIEFVSYSMKLSNISDREEGYKECMADYGLKQNIVIHNLRHDNLSKMKEIIETAKDNGIESLIFATNTLTESGIRAIYNHKWRIPEEFKVACFDSNAAFEIFNMDITYAKQPIEQFGDEALNLLMKNIDNKSKTINARVTLKPDIIRS